MKRLVFWQLFVAALLLTGNSHAQSIKDLFNKENIEKAVNAVTGKSTADMTGTWSYTGSAIEFESDNLLQKAGGAVAATAAFVSPAAAVVSAAAPAVVAAVWAPPQPDKTRPNMDAAAAISSHNRMDDITTGFVITCLPVRMY